MHRIVLILFTLVLICSYFPVRAQNGTSSFSSQVPAISFVSPQNNAQISGNYLIRVDISSVTTSVANIDIYAGDYWIGKAILVSGNSLEYSLSWNSTNITDGSYFFRAETHYYISQSIAPITLAAPKISVEIKNNQGNSATNNSTSEITSAQNVQTSATQDSTTNNTTSQKTTSITSNPAQTEITKTLQDQIANQSQWKTIKSIQIKKTSDQQLLKIEQKRNANDKNYLVFSGIAAPLAIVNLKISSDIINISTVTNSSGQWEYVFDKPLEPGKHSVSVSIVNTDGSSTPVGSTSFLIARAQAAIGNPNGESLILADPNQTAYITYFSVAFGSILLSIIIILMVLKYRKKLKGKNVQSR